MTLAQIDLGWVDAEGTYKVVDLANTPRGVMYVVEAPDGNHRLFDMDEVHGSRARATLHDPEVMRRRTTAENWSRANDAERLRCEERAKDLAEMMTGDRYGDVDTGLPSSSEAVNPKYDPELVSEGERVRRKSEELKRRNARGSGKSTLRQDLAKIKEPGGASNLVHGAFGRKRGPREPVSEAVHLETKRFIATRLGLTTVGKRALAQLLDSHLRKELGGEVGLAGGTLMWLLEHHGHGLQLWAKAETRESKATRTPDRQGKWQVTAPGQVVELDATRVDVLCYDQYGRVLNVVHCVRARDVLTHRTLAVRFVHGDQLFTAEVVRLLLWDIVAGNFLFPEIPQGPGSAGYSLPRECHIPVAAVNIDRGSQFNARKPLTFAAGVSIRVLTAQPGRGDKKPHIEGGDMRNTGLVSQLFPGAKGGRTDQRGSDVEDGPLLRIDQLVALMWLMIEGVENNTPKRGLASVRYPGRPLTPNEKLAEFYETGGTLELDPDPYRALDLLDTDELVIGDSGINFRNRRYTHPRLNFLRARTQTEPGSDGTPIVVYFDPADPRWVLVRDDDGAPIVATEQGHLEVEGVLADVRDRLERNSVAFGGAVGQRAPQELLRHLVDIARALAVGPKDRSRTPRPVPGPETKPSAAEYVVDIGSEDVGDWWTASADWEVE